MFINKQNNKTLISLHLFKMAKITRKKFSVNELSELEETVQKAVSQVETAQKSLAHLRSTKTSLRQKHANAAHDYR